MCKSFKRVGSSSPERGCPQVQPSHTGESLKMLLLSTSVRSDMLIKTWNYHQLQLSVYTWRCFHCRIAQSCGCQVVTAATNETVLIDTVEAQSVNYYHYKRNLCYWFDCRIRGHDISVWTFICNPYNYTRIRSSSTSRFCWYHKLSKSVSIATVGMSRLSYRQFSNNFPNAIWHAELWKQIGIIT